MYKRELRKYVSHLYNCLKKKIKVTNLELDEKTINTMPVWHHIYIG